MLSKVQYYHRRLSQSNPFFAISSDDFSSFGGETFCIEAPNTSRMVQFLNEYIVDKSSTIQIKLGYSYCNRCDRFIKKIGNKNALNKLESINFYINSVSIQDGMAIFNLNSAEYRIILKVCLSNHIYTSMLIGAY